MFVLDEESLKNSRLTQLLLILNISCFIYFSVVDVQYLLFFAQINNKVIQECQIWRIFTAMFLHTDIFHLFSNMLALFFFGIVIENNFSKLEYLSIYLISGVTGNLFSLVLLPPFTISLGASGAIFGLIGASFILTIYQDRTLIFLAFLYIIYFLIMSLAPGINLWAHLFGLLGGVSLGYIFYKRKKLLDY
ncbi:MAG: rhomboid family intramembrane serine protease [Promethearchaeota archaeon]